MEKNKSWFKNRKSWLDENVPVECARYVDYLTDIRQPETMRKKPTKRVYNLWGHMASPRSRGILLKDSHKYIRKLQ